MASFRKICHELRLCVCVRLMNCAALNLNGFCWGGVRRTISIDDRGLIVLGGGVSELLLAHDWEMRGKM